MTEVHTATVAEANFYSPNIIILLQELGFSMVGGILVGDIACEPNQAEGVVKVTQTIARNRIALGSNTKELVAKIKDGQELVDKLAGREDSTIGTPKIEFQKIWRLLDTEYIADMGAELISRGARHTGGVLQGVVGYDWQKDSVVVVQTVLAE